MNSTILRSQLWELWRLTRLELLLRLLTPLAYLCLSIYLPVLEGIVYFGIVLTSVTSQLWLQSFDQRQRGGFPFILSFTQPVPTRWLVGVPMAWLLVSNCLIYLGLVWVAQLILPTSYPGWVVLPFLLTVSACLAMATWSTTRFGERAVVTIAMAFVLAFCLRPRLVMMDPLEAGPNTLRHVMDFRLLENGILTVVTGIAVGVTIFFVRNQRCGEYHSQVGARASRVCQSRETGERRHPFSSRVRAQIWFEWRRVRVRAAAAVFTGLASMGFFTWLLGDDREGEAFGALSSIYLYAMLALILLVTEGVLGMKYRAKVLRLSVYEATQPISVGSGMVLKLGVTAGVALVGSVVLLFGAVCCAAVMISIDDMGRVLTTAQALLRTETHFGIEYGFVALAAYLLACLTAIHLAMGVGYCAPWLERHRVAFVFGLLFLLFPMFVLASETLVMWNFRFLYDSYLLTWGILLIAATVYGLRAVLKEAIYRPRPVALMVVLWVVCVVLIIRLVVLLDPTLTSLSVYAVVFLCGLCCIPIGSMAWAPLSLAAQRNQ